MKQVHVITRQSPLSGELNTMEIIMDIADYNLWQRTNTHIQDALPYLNAGEREFLKTGIHPEEWERLFK